MSIIVRPFRICLVALMLLLAIDAAAKSVPDAARSWAWSNTIQFPRDLQRDVEHMLRSSPTFRTQYRRIAEAGSVVVGVSVDPALGEGAYRARSTIRFYKSGLIVVAVVVPRGFQQAEWIAHEFEHIIE